MRCENKRDQPLSSCWAGLTKPSRHRRSWKKSILTILLHFPGFFLGSVRRDQAAMDREIEWARVGPEEADLTRLRAAHAMYLGKAKERKSW